LIEDFTGLPDGSIVAMRESALYKDAQDERFPWAETAGFRLADGYVREMIDAGYAVVVRVGYHGAPPERPEPEE
jgi:hypothetical protein